MKKTNLILIVLLLVTGSTVYAQRQPSPKYDKEKLESARVAFITNRLDIKPEQAEKFWPAFNQYSEERNTLMDQLSKISRSSEGEITDAQAKEMIAERLKIQQKLLDREKAFMNDITKVISPVQAMKLGNVNREFTRQVYRMQQGRGRGGN